MSWGLAIAGAIVAGGLILWVRGRKKRNSSKNDIYPLW